MMNSESCNRRNSSERIDSIYLPTEYSTNQDTNDNFSSLPLKEFDCHQLVRRYTDDLDNERIQLEVKEA